MFCCKYQGVFLNQEVAATTCQMSKPPDWITQYIGDTVRNVNNIFQIVFNFLVSEVRKMSETLSFLARERRLNLLMCKSFSYVVSHFKVNQKSERSSLLELLTELPIKSGITIRCPFESVNLSIIQIVVVF